MMVIRLRVEIQLSLGHFLKKRCLLVSFQNFWMISCSRSRSFYGKKLCYDLKLSPPLHLIDQLYSWSLFRFLLIKWWNCRLLLLFQSCYWLQVFTALQSCSHSFYHGQQRPMRTRSFWLLDLRWKFLDHWSNYPYCCHLEFGPLSSINMDQQIAFSIIS